MATLERTYNVPLRKEFLKAPRYKRAKKAVTALRQFLARHMKADKIIIGSFLNRKIWERGIKKPPHHVKVTAVKDEKGIVTAELLGAPKPITLEKEKGKAANKGPKAEELQRDAEELKEALAGELQKTEDSNV
ncbi:50S ribosomal protein L31e [Candidatus Woesearchaeota archaeon]|nr:50S ribosomal protein L31e [Candidatus Woesearchaeota archaeon]